MKWINLAKRQPDDLGNVILREVGDGGNAIVVVFSEIVGDDIIIDSEGVTFEAKLSELEWLDETLSSDEETFKAARVMERDPFSGLKIGYLFESFEDYLKCLEQ